MRVEVWADIICPWCGLGLHRLRTALAGFPQRAEVEVVHRSFQLDPSFPEDVVVSSRDMLLEKGMPGEQITAVQSRVEAMAAAEGLAPYRVQGNRVGSTALAHELLAYATGAGRHTQAWQHLFRAYFGEGRPVFSAADLVGLAGEIGLDTDAAAEALASRRYRDQVQEEAREAARLGATGVPFFVVGRRYGVAGAQDAATLRQVLDQAWAASEPAAPAP